MFIFDEKNRMERSQKNIFRVFLVVLLAFIFNFPFLLVFNKRTELGGIPLLFIGFFSLWGLTVLIYIILNVRNKI